MKPSSAVKTRQTSLLRSTSMFSSMTLLSRIVGFIRDIMVAHLFGASGDVDAFLIAFRIPNFMRRLFGEGAFAQAFVPVLAEIQTTRDDQESKVFIGKVAGTLAYILTVITIIAIIITPIIVTLSVPGFVGDAHRFQLTSEMLRITFPYLMLISLTALCGAVLNTYGNFAIPAFTPVLLNLSLLVAAVFIAPYFTQPVKALAWGVLFAGCAQLLFQFPSLWRANLLFKPRWAWSDPDVKRVVNLMVPALFGASVMQVNLFIDNIFASFLVPGSVSWFYYSNQLSNFPLGVFGVAITTVIMPQLSRKHASDDDKQFSATLDWAIRSVLLIAIPASIGLFLLSNPIVSTLFQSGNFLLHDVIMTSWSLQAFAFGIPAFMLIKILTASFYARQDIKTPVKIAIISMGANVCFNAMFITHFAHMGLALATSLSAYLNTAILFILLVKERRFQAQSKKLHFFLQIGLANILMIAWIIWRSIPITAWAELQRSNRVMHLGITIVGSLIIYLVALIASGFRLQNVKLGT